MYRKSNWLLYTVAILLLTRISSANSTELKSIQYESIEQPSNTISLVLNIFLCRETIYSVLIFVIPSLFKYYYKKFLKNSYREIILRIASISSFVFDPLAWKNIYRIAIDILTSLKRSEFIISLIICLIMQCIVISKSVIMTEIHPLYKWRWIILILKLILVSIDGLLIAHYTQHHTTREFYYFSPVILSWAPFTYYLIVPFGFIIAQIPECYRRIQSIKIYQEIIDICSFFADASLIQFFISYKWAEFLSSGGLCYPPSTECTQLKRNLYWSAHGIFYLYLIFWTFLLRINIETLQKNLINTLSLRTSLFNIFDILRLLIRTFLLGTRAFGDILCQCTNPYNCNSK